MHEIYDKCYGLADRAFLSEDVANHKFESKMFKILSDAASLANIWKKAKLKEEMKTIWASMSYDEQNTWVTLRTQLNEDLNYHDPKLKLLEKPQK